MPRAPAKWGRRRRRVVKGAKPDRLSDLPDEVLHCILSFLDSKSAVLSGILSSRWRPLWKTVPVLNFDGDFFHNKVQSFTDHVDRFLELRSGTSHSVVQHVSLLNCPGYGETSDVFTDVFQSICRCDQSLETLNLRAARLYTMDFALAGSGFKVLTTLTLFGCCLDSSNWNHPVDPFAGFPMLKNVKLISCSCCLEDEGPYDDETCLRVSGGQLLMLEIHALFGFDEIQVSAPKLESFTYRGVILEFSPVTEVSLDVPSLKQANVMLWGYMGHKQEANQPYANLLLDLSSVENLSLEFDTLEALINACDLVKHQSSPFRRLKALNVRFSEGTACVPDYVIRFFVDGSSFMDENSVKLTKVTTLSFPYNLQA